MKLRKGLNQLTWIVVSILSFSLLFSGLRFFEILLHRKYIFSYPLPDILIRFVYSFSVDFIFFLIFSSPYIVLYLLCEWFKKDKKFLFRKTFFHIIYIPLIPLFFLDMQTLAVQDRLFYSSLLSNFTIEMLFNSWIFLIDYWYLALSLSAALFIIFKYLPLIEKKPLSKRKILSSAYISFSLILLFCIVLTIGFKSLPFQREYRYNGLLMRLVNALHISRETCETIFFYKKEVLNNLKRKQKTKKIRQNMQSANIILFVLESLNAKYIEPNYMPFLFELSRRGIFLKNHIVTSHATVLSIYSLLNGKNNHESPINKTFMSDFLQAGYTLSFFYGEKKIIFNLATSLKKLGISHIAKEDYLKETGRAQDLNKIGGILDKPFLRFSAKRIKKQPLPFFSIIMTNQIHYPYYCPPFTKISHSTEKKIKDCAKYVDSALKNFFKDIKNSDWFNNTLFVFTADHSDSLDLGKQNYYFYQDNIPLIFYHPNKNLKRYENKQVSSHADIIPSLKDYLDLTRQRSVMHNSIFDLENKRRFFINRRDGFLLIEGNYLTKYSCRDNQSKTYLKDTRELVTDNKTRERFDKLIKSYIQHEYTLKQD